MLHRLLAVSLCVIGVSTAAPAQALTLLFTGVIDFVDDPQGLGHPADGSTFSVVVAFPTGISAPPGASGPPGQISATNVFGVPPGRYDASVGGWTIAPGPTPLHPDPRLEVILFSNPSADSVGIRTFSQQIGGSGLDFVTNGGRVTTSIFLEGPPGTLPPSLLLSGIPLDLSAWDFAGFDIEYYVDEDDNHDATYVSGQITSMTVLTPEPSTALLFGLGLLALPAVRRLRR